MSDKYYLYDCNSYTHCCQNTYRIDRKDRQETDDRKHPVSTQPAQVAWWKRLPGQKAKKAKT